VGYLLLCLIQLQKKSAAFSCNILSISIKTSALRHDLRVISAGAHECFSVSLDPWVGATIRNSFSWPASKNRGPPAGQANLSLVRGLKPFRRLSCRRRVEDPPLVSFFFCSHSSASVTLSRCALSGHQIEKHPLVAESFEKLSYESMSFTVVRQTERITLWHSWLKSLLYDTSLTLRSRKLNAFKLHVCYNISR